MSRISPSLRSRYSSNGPFAVTARSVWQQSQAIGSTTTSPRRARLRSKTAARSSVLPSSPVLLRPSSQAMPTCSGPAAHSDAKPCSATTSSSFTRTGAAQLKPPSTERLSEMSDACPAPPAFCSHCTHSAPSSAAMTCGTSAQFAISESPTTTVRASLVQRPLSPIVAKRSALRRPGTLFTQVSSSARPSSALAMCGCAEPLREGSTQGLATQSVEGVPGSSAVDGAGGAPQATRTKQLVRSRAGMRMAPSLRRAVAGQVHERQRDRGRGHPRDALRLAHGFRAHALELLPHLGGQAAHPRIVEGRRDRFAFMALLPRDFLALALEVAGIL